MLALPTQWKKLNHWTSYPARLKARQNIRKQRDRLDAEFEKLGPVVHEYGDQVLLADGMYDTPNHYFRLRIFMEAVSEVAHFRPLGVLRNHGQHAAERTLRSLGFKDFVYLEEDEIKASDFEAQADEMLSAVKTHSDILKIQLPDNMPAYVYYDTVSNVAKHPQPPLSSPLWKQCLCEHLRNQAIYTQLFDNNDIGYVPFSHPWKSEYAAAVWTGLRRNISAYHLTAYCETLRIQRFFNIEDYRQPLEAYTFDDFMLLDANQRESLIANGREYLNVRAQGGTTDINTVNAFVPDQRKLETSDARLALDVENDKPIAIIYAHAWFDFPHCLDMKNFTDFQDWMSLTLETCRQIDDVNWLIKPHPLEAWYGEFRLADMLEDKPENIRILQLKTDSLTAINAADAIVTVFGTIGIEASARGVPVISSDHSYYSDWNFTHEAESREDYVRLLHQVTSLAPPNPEKMDAAAAFAYLALAPHPDGLGLVNMPCDSDSENVHEKLIDRLQSADNTVTHERDNIIDWLESGTRSYAAYTKVKSIVNSDVTK